MTSTHLRSLVILTLVIWAAGNAHAEHQGVTALTAEDYAAIQQLYAQYAHGFDSKVDDGHMYVDVFSDDATFVDQYDTKTTGREGLLDRYGHTQTGRPNPISNSHSTWNVAIDPAPWGATGRSYKSNGVSFDKDRNPSPSGVPGVYYDILIKTPKGWRFSQRIFRQEFARPAAGNGRGRLTP